MKTLIKISKTIAAVLMALAIPALSLASTNPSPILDENNLYQIANVTTTGNWSASTSATYGDTISYMVHVHNNVIGSTAENVNVKVTLPSESITSYSSVATISADNATAVTGSTTLTLAETSKLTYVNGSATWYDHNNQLLGTLPDSIMTTGVDVGNINGCWEFETWIRFKVKVGDKPVIPAPTCSISANPVSIMRGSSSTLTFASANATSGSIDHNIGSVGTGGSKVVNPTDKTTYTYTVTGPGGTANCNATITVTEPPHDKPSCNITANPTSVQKGSSAELIFNSVNAKSGILDQGIGSVGTGGQKTVSPSQDTKYIYTVTGDGGTATCETSIKVESPVTVITQGKGNPLPSSGPAEATAGAMGITASGGAAYVWLRSKRLLLSSLTKIK
jgi:uncharacterized repeat protein (TIGR01451 family)